MKELWNKCLHIQCSYWSLFVDTRFLKTNFPLIKLQDSAITFRLEISGIQTRTNPVYVDIFVPELFLYI